MEEGDISNPIMGDIDTNFAGLENERKKQLRNKIIMWGAICIGILIIVIIIIILALNIKNDNEKKEDKEDDDDDDKIPKEIFGYLTCGYDVSSGNINILSEEFENKNNLVIYIGNKKIKFTKKYNFEIFDSKMIKFEIHEKEFSMEKMFKNVEYLQSINFDSDKDGKIISMESAFENCDRLKTFKFNKGFDTSQLTSMRKVFTNCRELKDIQFYNMSL